MNNHDVIHQVRDEGRVAPSRKPDNYKRLIADVTFGILALFMCLVVISLIQSKRTGEAPKFFGYQSYIVLSGSMSPSFNAGAMIFVKPVDASALQVGDVITFKGSSDSVTTTHRIAEINPDGTFVTKGDANDVNDPNPVRGNQVVGLVTLAIPMVGYVMDFARTKTGLLVLVVIPGAVIIASELRKLYQYAVELDREEQAKKNAQQEAEQASAS